MSLAGALRRLRKLEAQRRDRDLDWFTRNCLQIFARDPYDYHLVRFRQHARMQVLARRLFAALAEEGAPIPRDLLRDPKEAREYLAHFPGTEARDKELLSAEPRDRYRHRKFIPPAHWSREEQQYIAGLMQACEEEPT